MKISLDTPAIACAGIAMAMQYKADLSAVPVVSSLDKDNTFMIVIAIVMFINAYHLSRSTLFLVTAALSCRLAEKETGHDLSAVTNGLLAVGFGISSTAAPLKCKVYTAVGMASYYVAQSQGESDYWMICVYFSLALLLKRIFVMVMTARTSFPATYIFTFISNFMPAYYFSKYDFFRADACPEEIAVKREAAFNAMQQQWDEKWPKSIEFGHSLRAVFSDLRFAAGNRVFLPFRKILDDWCDPFTIATHTDRMNLIDVDGHEQLDISGSYGVNVVGYDRYKEFITKGWEDMKDLGCVLGPVHPILLDNINMLRQISKKQEVSFHMSGTEATMSAVRLARFNTKKNLVVMFSGAYHGWWDGVQSTAGNERVADDTLTLTDMADSSLRILRWRAAEISCVLVNPLQAFHANSPPPSDTVLATDNRNANADRTKYSAWLVKLKKTCADAGIVLIFDEVYTGFRLGPGGAQEYFGVEGDMVCYGKTLGGGMPNGVVCGPQWLMARCDPSRPLRLAYVIGTFSAHPLLLGSMNHFLKWVITKEAKDLYDQRDVEVKQFVIDTNAQLEKEDIPLKLASYCTVWTMLFQTPGRYHWILQYYLKDEGINLSWVGTGRLNFSLDFTAEDMVEVRERMMKACRRMKADGWWYYDPKAPKLAIKLKLGKEIVVALAKSLFGF
jgi:glutamate-1-semialdehyde 2,1-aminomutase